MRIGAQPKTHEQTSSYISLLCFSRHPKLSLGTRDPIWDISLRGIVVNGERVEAELTKTKILIFLSDSRGRLLTSAQNWHTGAILPFLCKAAVQGGRRKLVGCMSSQLHSSALPRKYPCRDILSRASRNLYSHLAFGVSLLPTAKWGDVLQKLFYICTNHWWGKIHYWGPTFSLVSAKHKANILCWCFSNRSQYCILCYIIQEPLFDNLWRQNKIRTWVVLAFKLI